MRGEGLVEIEIPNKRIIIIKANTVMIETPGLKNNVNMRLISSGDATSFGD